MNTNWKGTPREVSRYSESPINRLRRADETFLIGFSRIRPSSEQAPYVLQHTYPIRSISASAPQHASGNRGIASHPVSQQKRGMTCRSANPDESSTGLPP